MQQTMLTTNDNPFNPFEKFDEWFAFDETKGYHSCAKVAAITEHIPTEFDEETTARMIGEAIDEFVLNDPLNIYTKVTKDT